MEKQSIEQFLFTNSVNLDLDPILLLMNMAVAMLISLAISFHFLKLGSVFSNKTQLARLFPFITLTTVLVISVVKSSLALSLGLVGALSIVRFRTPIKEPEELVYLFLCIGSGLGFGAGLIIETTIAVIFILSVTGLAKFMDWQRQTSGMIFHVELPHEGNEGFPIQEISAVITSHVGSFRLKKMESDGSDAESSATFLLNLESPEQLAALSKDLHAKYPRITTSFFDQNELLIP